MDIKKDYIFGQHLTLLEQKVKSHIDSQNNPHGVTKADVGLNQVENYPSQTLDLVHTAESEAYATANAVLNHLESPSAGYIKVLGNEEVSGEPYHFTYYFGVTPSENKITVTAYTITLDNQKTLTQYPLDIVGASSTDAGLLTAADYNWIHTLNLENGAGTGSLQMKADGGAATFPFDATKNPKAVVIDPSLIGDIAYGASGEFATVLGGKNAARAKRSHAEGSTTITTANASYSHAEGSCTVTFGTSSHAEGKGTTAEGEVSHSEGINTLAHGRASHAEGLNTTASGNASHAEGDTTMASGSDSHAEGFGTTASGSDSHAEGDTTTASGNASHAEGYRTIASGNASHAEGDSTEAQGKYSHVGGSDSAANGPYSFAHGYNVTAGSDGAVVLGEDINVNGNYSAAIGQGLVIPNVSNEIVVGKYNKSAHEDNIGKVFVVGNGTLSARSNALDVYADGHAEISLMGNTDLSVATKKYVDEKFVKESGEIELSSHSGSKTAGLSLDSTVNPPKATLSSSAIINEGETTSSIAVQPQKIDINTPYLELTGTAQFNSNVEIDSNLTVGGHLSAGSVEVGSIKNFGHYIDVLHPAVLKLRRVPESEWPIEAEEPVAEGVTETFGNGWSETAGFTCDDGVMLLTPGGEYVVRIGNTYYLNNPYTVTGDIGGKGNTLAVIEQKVVQEFTPSYTSKKTLEFIGGAFATDTILVTDVTAVDSHFASMPAFPTEQPASSIAYIILGGTCYIIYKAANNETYGIDTSGVAGQFEGTVTPACESYAGYHYTPASKQWQPFFSEDQYNNIAYKDVANTFTQDQTFNGKAYYGTTYIGSVNSSQTLYFHSESGICSFGGIYPQYTNTWDLGTSSLKYKDGYFTGTVDMKYLGNRTTGHTVYLKSPYFAPERNNDQDLGKSSYKWKDLYLSGNISDGTNSATIAQIITGEVLKNISGYDGTVAQALEHDATGALKWVNK